MALVIEDGTLVSGADSYVSLADAKTYWTANGAPAAWTALDDPGKEARLRGAARYLQDGQRLPFTGTLRAWNQALVWPRTGATSYGLAVPSTVIPPQVIDAQLWLTVYGYAAGIVAPPGTTPSTNGNVKSQNLVGISRSFFSPQEMASGQAAATNAAPADVVGILYGLLNIGLLPVPGQVARPAPLIGASMVDPCSLDDVTRFIHQSPRWP